MRQGEGKHLARGPDHRLDVSLGQPVPVVTAKSNTVDDNQIRQRVRKNR